MDELEVARAKKKINNDLDKGLEDKIITKKEYDAMIANDKNPGKFYANFKVHKPHKHKETPPVRPINSGSGSMTEGIATFVEYHIKESAVTHKSYIEDTPDFLRYIAKLNKGPKLNKNTVLVTFDVEGLFTNILHKDGLQCLRDQLDIRTSPKVPTDFLVNLMEIILQQNIFSFHDALWKEEVGAAMGSKPVPSYANIFMANIIDKAIITLASKYNKKGVEALQMLKRFLDDYFSLFIGTTKDLHKLLDEINKIHPTIRLTMNHTSIEGEALENKCGCKEEASFLSWMSYAE